MQYVCNLKIFVLDKRQYFDVFNETMKRKYLEIFRSLIYCEFKVSWIGLIADRAKPCTSLK